MCVCGDKDMETIFARHTNELEMVFARHMVHIMIRELDAMVAAWKFLPRKHHGPHRKCKQARTPAQKSRQPQA